ncbi:MAG: dockerin type I domain-containing protein [Tepidisphaeraceae bacterium]|jgi:hypothetical protein
MNTARVSKKWIACLLLMVIATAATGQQYQFQIDQPSSGGSAQLGVNATTDGTLIGNYDGTTNPTGTRTKPVSSFLSAGPGPTENLPVPVSHMDPNANGNVVFSPSGSFQMIFDTVSGSVTLAGFTTSLLGGNSASIPVNAALSFNQFKTANPANWYPATSTAISLGNATVSLLSATQTADPAVGTLAPMGGDLYSFSVTPTVILEAKVDLQGSSMDIPSNPMPFPLQGSVTLSGNTATLVESAPVNLSDSTSPNQLMSPVPYDLPATTGTGPSHVILNLTLRTTQTTVTGTQNLRAAGTVMLPVWTGASAQSSAWSSPDNWSATVPNAANAVAHFSTSTAPRDVTLDIPVTVGTIEFSADQPYTVSGPHPITFSSSGSATLSAIAGPSTGHTIAAPLVAQSNLDIDIAASTALNLPQGLTIAPAITVAKTADPGTLHLGPVIMQSPSSLLSIASGQTTIARLDSGQLQIGSGAAVTLDPGASPSILDGLNLQGSATFDLSGNDLILKYTGLSPYSTFAQFIAQRSIFTSEASPGATAAVALVDNAMLHLATWRGQSISDGVNFSQLLLVSTCAGDNNLDGVVDASDYYNVIANMGKTNATWFDGDMDGDGVVSAADFAIVTRNMGAGAALPASSAADVVSAGVVSVPEPAGLGLLGMVALSLLYRRRHTKHRPSIFL